jgi:hypothetical protein
VDADLGKGTGSAARARELYAATLFRRASALALIGIAIVTAVMIIPAQLPPCCNGIGGRDG